VVGARAPAAGPIARELRRRVRCVRRAVAYPSATVRRLRAKLRRSAAAISDRGIREVRTASRRRRTSPVHAAIQAGTGKFVRSRRVSSRGSQKPKPVQDLAGGPGMWSSLGAQSETRTCGILRCRLSLDSAVDRFLPRGSTCRVGRFRPRPTSQSGDGAAHPIEQPSTTLAALRILALAQAMAAVRALPSPPMTARSGAPNCRIQAQRNSSKR
jgi:hypothetical protein